MTETVDFRAEVCLTPAARRAGDSAAIDDLGTAVVIVDDGGWVVNLNRSARTLLGGDEGPLLGRDFDAVLPGVDLTGTEQTVSMVTDEGNREFAVATSPLTDSAERHVGHTVILQDITAEKRREQRLMVLNRVLRHNLRNGLNVVQGNIRIAEDRIDDEDAVEALTVADVKTAEVMELGEKPRLIEGSIGTRPSTHPVEIPPLVEDVIARLDPPAGSVHTRCPDDLVVVTDPDLLDGVLTNLIENAIQHNDGADPKVSIVCDREGTGIRFEIADNGPGIPDHERSVLEAGEETDLEHGSGLGLWYVKWAVYMLGGHIAFEVSESGTTVSLTITASGADDRSPEHDSRPS